MRLVLATLIALLVGCVFVGVAPMYVTQSVYDPDEVNWSLKKGTASIEGNGFMRQQGGGIVKCSGEKVYLVASGTYSRERMHTLYEIFIPGETSSNRMRDIDDPDPRYVKDQRKTVCDVDGKFRFEDLPEGTYFINTRIIWKVGENHWGGNLSQQIDLSSGEHVKVMLYR
jgi:hypothetical protein